MSWTGDELPQSVKMVRIRPFVSLLSLLALCSLSETSSPRPAGLWMLDGFERMTDLSGNGNHGNWSQIHWITGPHGRGVFYLLGASDKSDRVDIIQQNNALQFTGDSTYMIYILLKSGADGPLFNIRGAADMGVTYFICCGDTGKFHFRFDDPNSAAVSVSVITASLPIDEWVHVALVRNQADGTVKYYLNGEEDVSSRQTGFTGPLDAQHDNIISTGAWNPTVSSDSRVLKAGVYCQAYFNAALTTSQVRAWKDFCMNYETFNTYPWPKAVAVYPLNEYYGAQNAAEGLSANGVLHYELYTNYGPGGEPKGSIYLGTDLDSSYVSISNANGELAAPKSWTYMTYINMYSTERSPLFEYMGSNGGHTWHIWINYPNPTQLFMNDAKFSAYSSPVGSLKQGAWQHIAVSYDYSSGKAIMVIDDEIADERNLGNVQIVQTDDFFIGYRDSDRGYRLGADLSCVMIFDQPLDLLGIRRARDRCDQYQPGYKPLPSLVMPFNGDYGLRTMVPRGRAADYNSDGKKEITFARGYRAAGYRKALNVDHVYFDDTSGHTITPPNVVKTDWPDWTFSIILTVWNNSRVEMLGGRIVFDTSGFDSLNGLDYITYKFGDEPAKHELLSTKDVGIYNDYWIVFTHDSSTNSVAFYRNNYLRSSRYVANGFLPANLPLEIKITEGRAELGCYQVFDKFLTLSDVQQIKYGCYKEKVGPKALPLPRGFWTLDGERTRFGLTIRSGGLETFGDIWYNATGPFGRANGAASFDPERSTSFSIGRIVCGSITISLWIKQKSAPTHRKIIFGSYPGSAAAISNRGSDVGVSIELVPGGAVGTLKFYTVSHVPKQSKLYNPTLDYNVSVPIGEWYHVAAKYDMTHKRSSLYVNGELVASEQVHRHIIFGDWRWLIGNLRFQQGDDLEYQVWNGTEWGFHGDMSCPQMYDAALSHEQINFTRTLCHPSKYAHFYDKHQSMAKGWSRRSDKVARRVKARNQPECLDICSQDENCLSVAFGNGDCDIEEVYYSSTSTYEYTGKNYLEKVFRFADPSIFY